MTPENHIYPDVALLVPQILLPSDGIDLQKWAVVACDQFTSEPEYWQEVSKYVADNPSTYHLIFPECYLQDPGSDDRINRIHNKMQEYLDSSILHEQQPALYLTVRQTPDKQPRTGIVAAIDLEQYDFKPGSKSLIRPTEGTILDRIPPRKKIRTNAALELPHVMVLIDDREKKVIEPLAKAIRGTSPIYDFKLMKDSGRIKSFQIQNPDLIQTAVAALKRLSDPDRFEQKYQSRDVILYAVGDGNHSLATAKEVWEELKRAQADSLDIENHPARWALVEIINIYDQGLELEPIHRALFGVKPEDFLSFVSDIPGISIETATTIDEIREQIEKNEEGHRIGLLTQKSQKILTIRNSNAAFPVAALQDLLDTYLAGKTTTQIDYIHGFDSLVKIAGSDLNIGFLLPSLHKDRIFPFLLKEGTFPRKSFSIGEAWEKRFYIEARKII